MVDSVLSELEELLEELLEEEELLELLEEELLELEEEELLSELLEEELLSELEDVELLELEAVVVFPSVLSLQPTKARTAKSIATTIMRDKNFFMIKVLLLIKFCFFATD